MLYCVDSSIGHADDFVEDHKGRLWMTGQLRGHSSISQQTYLQAGELDQCCQRFGVRLSCLGDLLSTA